MVNQAKEKKKQEPEPVMATQADFLRMFYLLLKQQDVTPDNPMVIDVKAFKAIPTNAKMCGEIDENGMLSIWLPESKKQKNKKERKNRKLVLPNRTLILPRKDS